MSVDRIADVLSQQAQQAASALGQYQGQTAVAAENKNKLKRLLAQLKSLLGQFPPQIAAMLAGVIAECEALLAAGGPAEAIGAMIAKIERLIAILMDLLAELTTASGELNLEALIAFLSGLAANLDAAKKAHIAKLIRNLRRAAAAGSLKGLDEASWEDAGFGDGSKPVEPSQQNVMQSLQALLEAVLASKTRVVARSTAQPAPRDG